MINIGLFVNMLYNSFPNLTHMYMTLELHTLLWELPPCSKMVVFLTVLVVVT